MGANIDSGFDYSSFERYIYTVNVARGGGDPTANPLSPGQLLAIQASFPSLQLQARYSYAEQDLNRALGGTVPASTIGQLAWDAVLKGPTPAPPSDAGAFTGKNVAIGAGALILLVVVLMAVA